MLSVPPVFRWTAIGGSNNVYAAELSMSASFANYWSTYEDLQTPQHGNNWQMPLTVWNRIAPSTPIYWRVRGVDLDKKPLVIVPSQEVWSFTKQ